MQDRYTGDVGDFGKYGLLRAIALPEVIGMGGPSLKLGVLWYPQPNEGHNQDGKHVSYLSLRKRQDYRICDPHLYDCLARIVNERKRRAVSEVEKSNILGADARFFSEGCSSGPRAKRTEWHAKALGRHPIDWVAGGEKCSAARDDAAEHFAPGRVGPLSHSCR